MTGNEIPDFLKTHKDGLRQIYGVQEIAMEKKTLTNFFGLKRYLEQHLGEPVDLGIASTMKPVVKKLAQKEMLYV